MLARALGTATLLLLLLTLLWPTAYETIYRSNSLMTLDRQAEDQIDASLKRALAVFALARATNAVISVVQGTEVNLAPAGLGVTLTPGEALDPVNDLIERFSWVMLASSTALGIQKFLIAFGEWVSLKLILPLSLVAFLVTLWSRKESRSWWLLLATRLCLLALVLRLAAPAVTLVNQGVYHLFFSTDYLEATRGLEQGHTELEQAKTQLAADSAETDGSLWQRLKQSGEKLAQAVDIEARLKWLEQKASEVVDHLLQLIVIFVLNTILLPLLFLWGVWRLSACFFSTGFREQVDRLVGFVRRGQTA